MADESTTQNNARTPRFRKDEQAESFLDEFNNYLAEKERKEYRAYPVEHPFLFVIGLPRSGTTLITQLIAHSLDLGFIDNLAARFYRAPLHGIRFSKSVLGDKSKTDYQSTFASTGNLSDIHEFGYFWKHWLKIESLQDIARYREREKEVDWQGLKACLSSLQHEFGSGMIFKNIYGSYHMPKLNSLLDKTLFIRIERDEPDVACSILKARKQYYGEDLDRWWSYAPPRVTELLDLGYEQQIAGQIVYLKQFYEQELDQLPEKSVLKVRYRKVCNDPAGVIEQIRERCRTGFDSEIGISDPPPDSFPHRTYNDRPEERERFRRAIENFRNRHQ